MSNVKRALLKTGVAAIIVWGGYSWINQSPEHKEAVTEKTAAFVQTTETQTQAALDKTREFTDATSLKAGEALGDLSFSDKAGELQDRAKPLRRSIKTAASPVTRPVVKGINALDKKISILGILFMLVTGGVVAVMGASLFTDDDYA